MISNVHLKSYAMIFHEGLDFLASHPDSFELAFALMKAYQELEKLKAKLKTHQDAIAVDLRRYT